MDSPAQVWFPNMGIKIQELNRVAFTIFDFPVYWYGIILIGIAVPAGMIYAVREAKRTKQNPDLYTDFLLYALIACIIGARLYYVVFSWDEYKNDLLKIFAFREGGLAIYGTVIAAIITAFVYTKRKKMNFFLFCDTCAPGLILGQCIGRWANFVNMEAFGGYTDNVFAMRYLLSSVSSVPQSVLENTVMADGFEYIQVHPTFLYESIWSLCVFIIMIIYRKRKKFDGEILAIYFLGYGLGRAWIEGLRTDQLLIGSTGIAVSQIFSVILIIAAIVLIIIKRKSKSLGSAK